MTKEVVRNSNKLELVYNMMQLVEVPNASQVWHELTKTIGQTIAGKTEFSAEEYLEITNDQLQNVFAIIFENGKERKNYVDAHKSQWKDVATQLNLISNHKRVIKIFKQ